ncbi:hypothetical protein [Sagittula sp. S175]|uniref:hypothetical protein n=1 Tax=Sagittula sp. S175 TaxID=3415129 RepID=UPI003C7AAC04
MSPRAKRWLIGIWAALFVTAWTLAMTSGLTGAGCRKDRYEGAAKLRYCSISLALGGWTRLDARERARSASLYLERGIAQAQLGRDDAARADFARAIADAQAFAGPWLVDLETRMADFAGTPAARLWEAVAVAPAS